MSIKSLFIIYNDFFDNFLRILNYFAFKLGLAFINSNVKIEYLFKS